MSAVRDAVVETIGAASLRLDDDDFDGFLALCAPDFRYTIQAFSPEIRREMTWLDVDRAELETLFRTLPRHNSDHAPLTRHVTVATVSPDEAGGSVSAISALQVFRTALDGGGTALFAVGKIHDQLAWDGARAVLQRRQIRLATRLLGIGSHKPL
jgi:methanesulfonate monooxygenase small subunit